MPIDLIDGTTSQSEIRVGEIFKEYGNVAINFNVSGYRTMSLDEFRKDVLPTLQPVKCSQAMSYYVIRDLSHKTCYCLLPDCVEEFRVSSWYEITTDKVREKLMKEAGPSAEKEIVFDLPVPLLKYRYNETSWTAIVKIPHTKFMYRSTLLAEYIGDGILINLPPCIFKVKANNNDVVQQVAVYVIKADSVVFDNIKLAHLPLPNIYNDGSVCMGSTRIEDQASITSKGQLVMAVWDLFINSNWNLDLLTSNILPDNLSAVYETLPVHAVDTGCSTGRVLSLLQLLDCLHDDTAYLNLNWAGLYGHI